MNDPGIFQLLMASDPRQLAKFPPIPLEKAMGEVQALKNASTGGAAPAPSVVPAAAIVSGLEPVEALGSSIATLATHIWRAQTRMVDPKTGEAREETRRLYRHIEGALDTFASMGVRLSDWVGQPYDAGLPVKVLSFQPTADLACDTVIEAVRPAVFWQDRLLQVGEVIVGIPQPPSNKLL